MAYMEKDINDSIIGGGGFGGSWCIIIVFFVIAWLLFKDGHKSGYDGYAGFGGFGGCGCGPCVQPTFKDESNFEEERNINAKLCGIDRDIWENGCKDREATHCEGEKTRALIEQNYIQDLRDKLAATEMEKLTLKQEMFTEKKFDQMLIAIGAVKGDVDKLACELPKRPPVWSECVTPNTHHTDCDRFPRRGHCGDECFA